MPRGRSSTATRVVYVAATETIWSAKGAFGSFRRYSDTDGSCSASPSVVGSGGSMNAAG